MTDNQTAKPPVKTDAAIISKFFGRKPGQSLQEHLREIQALSVEEKAELVALINDTAS